MTTYRLGDTNPEIRAIKTFMRRKFAAYAGALADTDVFDQPLADAVSEMQRRYSIPVSGVLNYGTQITMGYTAKPVMFTVNGFMGDMWQQMPADTARALGALVEFQPVGYQSNAFPLGTGADSGVRELKRLINDVYPGRKIILAGYSLGAIITADVFDALRSGDLRHRWNDFVAAVSWGDPRREAHHQAGPDPGGEGIAGGTANLVNTPWNYRSWVNPGDIYANNPIGEAGREESLIFNFVMLKWRGSLLSVIDEASHLIGQPIPATIAIIQSVIGGITFFSNQTPHGAYTIDGALRFLRDEIMFASGPTTPGGDVVTPTPSPMPGTPQTPTKSIIALIGSVLTFLVPLLLQVNTYLPAQWQAVVGALIALATATGVYVVPNRAKAPEISHQPR
jgi:hypothetical protein